MKYRTKVRELEAIRFDGTNIEAIKTLTGLQFELMETLRNVKYLLCGGGLVNGRLGRLRGRQDKNLGCSRTGKGLHASMMGYTAEAQGR